MLAESVSYAESARVAGKATPLCTRGWAGDGSARCRCTPDLVRRYRARISGPLLERIDLHVEVPRLPPSALRAEAADGEDSATVRARVTAAHARQRARAGTLNARLDHGQMGLHCRLAPADQRLLEDAIERLQLSARSLHRITRVARTIADLAGQHTIGTAHLAEALGYRGWAVAGTDD